MAGLELDPNSVIPSLVFLPLYFPLMYVNLSQNLSLLKCFSEFPLQPHYDDPFLNLCNILTVAFPSFFLSALILD